MQSEYAKNYASLYHGHWWWRSRERILVRLLRSLGLPQNADVLDVGCGDALFFSRLREFGTVRGIEADGSLLDPENPNRSAIYSEPLGDPSYSDMRFDLITACDVIEHIEDDRGAIAHMTSMLKPAGFLVITVPAFMSLWDEHDELNLHFRRYRADDLRKVIPSSVTILQMRYLFHSIFIPKYVVRMVNRKRTRKVDQTKIPPLPLNTALTTFCDWENRMLGSVNLPFGTSLLAVVRRQSS